MTFLVGFLWTVYYILLYCSTNYQSAHAQWVEAEAVVPNKLFEILFILYITSTVIKQSIEMLVGGGGGGGSRRGKEQATQGF